MLIVKNMTPIYFYLRGVTAIRFAALPFSNANEIITRFTPSADGQQDKHLKH